MEEPSTTSTALATSATGRRLRRPATRPVAASERDLWALRRFHFARDRKAGPSRGHGLEPVWIPGIEVVRHAGETSGDRPRTSGDALLGDGEPVRALWTRALEAGEAARHRWRHRSESLVEGLRSLHERIGPLADGRGAEQLGHELGRLGSEFVDAEALARLSTVARGAVPSSSARLRRVEETLASLEASSGRGAADGAAIFCAPALTERVAAVFADRDGSRAPMPDWFAADDACLAAAEHFDREAARTARELAAARVATLELEDAYRPEIHDAALEVFDWKAFRASEVALVPPVVVVLDAESAVGPGLWSLSRLLRSGRPVQILVLVEPSGGEDLEVRSELAYLGLAHRGAYVAQGSPVDPTRLTAGFERGLATAGAALHVVAIPPPWMADASVDRYLRAALAGRAHPALAFDPGAGRDWASRFELEGNPDPADDWPRTTVSVECGDGIEPLAQGSESRAQESEPLDVAFTFADFALCCESFRADFLVIDDGLTSDALVPIADWLGLPPERSAGALPFVWGVDEEGRLRRLLVRQRLALQTRDRLDYWRTLQQLAGIHDPYVETAHARDRRDYEERLQQERERLEREHRDALASQRQDVARDVVQRLLRGLEGC